MSSCRSRRGLAGPRRLGSPLATPAHYLRHYGGITVPSFPRPPPHPPCRAASAVAGTWPCSSLHLPLHPPLLTASRCGLRLRARRPSRRARKEGRCCYYVSTEYVLALQAQGASAERRLDDMARGWRERRSHPRGTRRASGGRRLAHVQRLKRRRAARPGLAAHGEPPRDSNESRRLARAELLLPRPRGCTPAPWQL